MIISNEEVMQFVIEVQDHSQSCQQTVHEIFGRCKHWDKKTYYILGRSGFISKITLNLSLPLQWTYIAVSKATMVNPNMGQVYVISMQSLNALH